MPMIKCAYGRTTNTAASKWTIEDNKPVAIECYASWDADEHKWVKGCGYDKSIVEDSDNKYATVHFAKQLIDSY